MMFVEVISPMYRPLARAPAASDGGAIVTVTLPSASGPSATAWTSYERSRGCPVSTPASARSTARNNASTAPLPSAEASHWWSPAAITTAPRLLAFEPDVTVQRARWRVSPGSVVSRSADVGVVAIVGYLPVGDGAGEAGATDAVVKCRSSRRRSSAPDFQIAYSRES